MGNGLTEGKDLVRISLKSHLARKPSDRTNAQKAEVATHTPHATFLTTEKNGVFIIVVVMGV